MPSGYEIAFSQATTEVNQINVQIEQLSARKELIVKLLDCLTPFIPQPEPAEESNSTLEAAAIEVSADEVPASEVLETEARASEAPAEVAEAEAPVPEELATEVSEAEHSNEEAAVEQEAVGVAG